MLFDCVTGIDEILFPSCSRPTAVNLSDAAVKLKEVIKKAATTAKDANSVFQVVTLSCLANTHLCYLNIITAVVRE